MRFFFCSVVGMIVVLVAVVVPGVVVRLTVVEKLMVPLVESSVRKLASL